MDVLAGRAVSQIHALSHNRVNKKSITITPSVKREVLFYELISSSVQLANQRESCYSWKMGLWLLPRELLDVCAGM